MFSALPTVIQLLLSFVVSDTSTPTVSRTPPSLRFHLRHEHAVTNDTSRNVFRNIAPSFASTPYELGSEPVRVYRPSSQAAFTSARFGRSGAEVLRWDEDVIPGPNVSSRATLQTLARMTNNAYSEPTDPDWYDLGPDWNKASVVCRLRWVYLADKVWI
jgi:putative lipase involved disintegration of autophagic bodies